MKVIDGMVYCNEIDKWVTVEEYIKEYKLWNGHKNIVKWVLEIKKQVS